MVPRLGLVALAVALVACDGAVACEDTDLDGYGPGCAAGDDCDPDNAARNVDCASIPPPDCAADPTATGCPCLPGAIASCLDERHGIGVCRAGRTQCVNRFWGACEGGVGPTSELCDGIDQDCDGIDRGCGPIVGEGDAAMPESDAGVGPSRPSSLSATCSASAGRSGSAAWLALFAVLALTLRRRAGRGRRGREP